MWDGCWSYIGEDEIVGGRRLLLTFCIFVVVCSWSMAGDVCISIMARLYWFQQFEFGSATTNGRVRRTYLRSLLVAQQQPFSLSTRSNTIPKLLRLR